MALFGSANPADREAVPALRLDAEAPVDPVGGIDLHGGQSTCVGFHKYTDRSVVLVIELHEYAIASDASGRSHGAIVRERRASPALRDRLNPVYHLKDFGGEAGCAWYVQNSRGLNAAPTKRLKMLDVL
jgi:hypothetical protein